jgi:hypothetical protein
MSTENAPHTGLERDLTQAIDELEQSLEQAAAAAGRLRAALPRIAASSTLLDQLEEIVRSGREQLGAAPARQPAAPAPSPFPSQRAEAPPPPIVEQAAPPPPPTPITQAAAPPVAETPAPATGAADAGTVTFRLQFQSRPGPLDLRAVDEAVSEHPDVRDVALLDYDGHRATLKVWADASADIGSVQDAITARARELFASTEEFSVEPVDEAA